MEDETSTTTIMASVATDDDDAVSPLSEEAMRKLLKPVPTDKQVLQILKEHFCERQVAGDAKKTTNDNKNDDDGDDEEEEDDRVKILQHLDSYDDYNYKVEVEGQIYLLKIHNGVESEDFISCLEEAKGEFYKKGHMNSVIHLQNAMMELFADSDILTCKPVKPVKNRGGSGRGSPVLVASLPVFSAKHSPCDLVVRLLTWVPGKTLSSVQYYTMEALADAGRFLGRIDKILDNLNSNTLAGAMEKVGSSAALLRRGSFVKRGSSAAPVPARQYSGMDQFRSQLAMSGAKKTNAILDESLLVAARRYHQWDGKNTADLRRFVHYIENSRRRGLVTSVLDAFQRDILDSGVSKRFRTGVNHSDFNDANIIMDDNMNVSGVIDFGDSVESWRILDITVGMAYAMVSNFGKSNRSLAAAAGVLRGYNTVYPMSDLEKKHLRLLIACRLACSATLGAYSYKQNPDNEYLLLHAEPAWTSLELIWSYDKERREKIGQAMDHLFDQACLHSNPRAKVIECYDLVVPDPDVADLLDCVRINAHDPVEPPKKKQKIAASVDTKKNGIPTITLVTGYDNKLEEVQRILQPKSDDAEGATNGNLRFQLKRQRLDDLLERQGDPIEIARVKCLAAAEEIGGAVITETTSLCFNALNNLPGPYIKSFLKSCGLDGLNKILSAFDDKTGYAQTVVAFCPGPGQDPVVFDGRTFGKIVPPRGSAEPSFFDPIFEPNGGDKTFAEMTADEKATVCHRCRAYEQMRDYLNKSWEDVSSKMQ